MTSDPYMFAQILIFLLGCLVTWIISHIYYRKTANQSAEYRKILDKLPEIVIEKLKNDVRPNLSIKELNELINIKSRDFSKQGLDSYKICPSCGGDLIRDKELIDVDVDSEPDGSYSYNPVFAQIIKCKQCNWILNEFDAEASDKN